MPTMLDDSAGIRMQPRTREVLSHLDNHRAALTEALDAVPVALRERRPAPNRWSVAEILEHLGIVEGGITQLLQKQVDAARAAGHGPERETSPVVPTVPVDRLLDRSAPLTASTRSQPSGTLSADAAWEALSHRRRALQELLLTVDGLALSEVIIPHPILGSLNVYQWLVFVGAHEGRHARQIREISAAARPA
jgi:hypothetical protein